MSPGPRTSLGFSLVELLTVILLISILAVLAVPTALSFQQSMNVTSAGQLLQQKLVLARQAAIARDRITEIRFYQIPSSNGGPYIRAFQIYVFDEKGINPSPLEKLTVLPAGTCLSGDPALSTILQASPHSGSQPLPSLGSGTFDFRSFRFGRGGSTDLDWNGLGGTKADTWFVTVEAERDHLLGASPPRNLYTVQIDPVTGITSYFRP